MTGTITFTRLPGIDPGEIAAHMSDPRLADHMPLLSPGKAWDAAAVARFVALKEDHWARDGLGHWAILCNACYVGWGGFQQEEGEWDFGLVLKPDAFGLGHRITRRALAFAAADDRIPYVTFRLPPSRRKLGALARLGARYAGQITQDGAVFLKFVLETQQQRAR
ncbi:MAG: GNAT family N-acetyltransferase [Pseudomonadota bacterium]